MKVPVLEQIRDLLLAIDTRLVEMRTEVQEVDVRVARMQADRVAEDEAEAAAPKRRRPSPAQVQRETAILAALEAGPLTLTEIARAIHRTGRITERETTAPWSDLQRMMREGVVSCDERKRYALRRDRNREEASV